MTSPAVHVLEHRLLAYRRTFRGSLFNSFLSPVLFLAAMGLGIGGYMGASAAAALGGVSYLAFLAPGLLAANAMQTAAGEATFPVLAAITWVRQFHAMIATPISVRDIVVGHLGYWTLRLLLVATIFVGVTVLLGGAVSAGIVLAIPAAALTGLAFATPIAAFSTTLRDGSEFSLLFRFAITPLFLYSATFFPITQLPPVLQAVATVTPLYQGVALTRGLALGTLTPTEAAIHVGYLAVLAVVGAVAFERLLARRMTP
jgi:lipooligosaccharide transport system permease protein